MTALWIWVMMMHISSQGLEFIKEHEGCVLDWYQDSAGHWTIGVGHMNDSKILPAGFTSPLTEQTALDLLNYDIPRYENIVNNAFPGRTFLQQQFDALVSFAFNEGTIWNGLKNAINNGVTGDDLKAVFEQYCMAGGQPILLSRRDDEYELYEFGTYNNTGGTGGTGGGGGWSYHYPLKPEPDNSFAVIASAMQLGFDV
jgi:lysozyme